MPKWRGSTATTTSALRGDGQLAQAPFALLLECGVPADRSGQLLLALDHDDAWTSGCSRDPPGGSAGTEPISGAAGPRAVAARQMRRACLGSDRGLIGLIYACRPSRNINAHSTRTHTILHTALRNTRPAHRCLQLIPPFHRTHALAD
jgi:hypothetical protein